jgi:hypothetical protein
MALLMGGVTGGRASLGGDLVSFRGRLRRGDPGVRSDKEEDERDFNFCMFPSMLSYPVSGKVKRE